MRVTVEVETAEEASFASKVLATLAEALQGSSSLTPGAAVVSPGALVAHESTRRRNSRRTADADAFQADAVAVYNTLAAVAGVVEIQTATPAAITDESMPAETDPPVVDLPVVDTAAAQHAADASAAAAVAAGAPIATRQELIDLVRKGGVDRGIQWVRDNILTPHKATKLSDLTDDQLRALAAQLGGDESAQVAA